MICQGYLMHWESIGCIVIVCSYVPLSERYSGHAPSSTYHELILPALQWIFIAFDEMPVVHQSTRSLVHFALTRAVVTYCSSLRVRVFLLFFIGRHCETHLLSLHRIPKNFLLFLLLSFFLSFFIQVSRLNLNARAFSARVVWLSTDRALCWNPFLSSCFNQSELTPLSYFMRGDFFWVPLPLCRWFWQPLHGRVFKRGILVLTGELTLLPSLLPGCLADGIHLAGYSGLYANVRYT